MESKAVSWVSGWRLFIQLSNICPEPQEPGGGEKSPSASSFIRPLVLPPLIKSSTLKKVEFPDQALLYIYDVSFED